MKTKYGFPAIIFIISILHIIQIAPNFLSASLIVTLIGLMGIVLFFGNNNKYVPLFYIWICAQFLIITSRNLSTNEVLNIFNFTQFKSLAFTLGFSMKSASSATTIDFYFFPILYLILFHYLRVDQLIGKKYISKTLETIVF